MWENEALQRSAQCYEAEPWDLIITTIKENCGWRRPSSSVWKEVWACKERNQWKRYSTRGGKDPPRSTPSQFFQESVSMRQLWGEAFISLRHCITAGLLEKAVSLCGGMKKIRIRSPPPLNRLGPCEQSHICSRHVTLWRPGSDCRHPSNMATRARPPTLYRGTKS